MRLPVIPFQTTSASTRKVVLVTRVQTLKTLRSPTPVHTRGCDANSKTAVTGRRACAWLAGRRGDAVPRGCRWESSPTPHLDPLLAVYLDAVGPQRGDGSVDDLLHHLRVPVGLLQLGSCDPDVPVCGDVLPGLIQDLAGILVGLQPCQSEPELDRDTRKERTVFSGACGAGAEPASMARHWRRKLSPRARTRVRGSPPHTSGSVMLLTLQRLPE